MIYLDDNMTGHPKILRAAKRLGGPNAGAAALTLYLEGLAYTRHHLTDGIVPTLAIEKSSLVASPKTVAAALVAVKLWHRVPNGFRIHDYHDWNKSAAELKRERRKWREKKRRQRSKTNGRFTEESRGVSPRDEYRDSRARTRSHVPQPRTPEGGQPRSVRTGFSTDSDLTARFARGIHAVTEKKTPTHRILCAMARAELADPTNTTYADQVEAVKLRLVRQGFDYPEGGRIAAAIEAVERADRRRGIAS